MEWLVYLGFGILILGGIGFLIAAFKQSLIWGLGCLLFAPIALIFLFVHWSEARNPFFLQLLGFGILFVASMPGGAT